MLRVMYFAYVQKIQNNLIKNLYGNEMMKMPKTTKPTKTKRSVYQYFQILRTIHWGIFQETYEFWEHFVFQTAQKFVINSGFPL